MDVTIEIKETTAEATYEVQEKKNIFGKMNVVKVPIPPKPSWDVYLTLIPTEEERATLIKFKINQQHIEKVPAFTLEQISDAYYALQTALRAWNPKENRIDALEKVFNERTEEEREVRIEEYFNNPYIRRFGHIQPAHDYVDKLKQEILPRIKRDIDHFSGRVEKESFSL
jgi:hypothetical protein